MMQSEQNKGKYLWQIRANGGGELGKFPRAQNV